MQHPVLLLLLCIVTTIKPGRLPSCANGQHPKLDKVGRPIQCLPGSSSRSVCGVNHTCFFSGMNYMCCPSNEPSHDNQPACPSPLLTVLDSHGLPLKCNPRSRICPQEKGTCSDVGLAYICCEHVADELHSNSVVARDRKRAPQKKSLMKAAVDAEESLDCPQNSIGLLNGDGSRVMCNSRRRCPGESTFCHGAFKRSICCEPFEFASNVLDSVENITTSKLVKSLETFRSAKIKEETRAATKHIVPASAARDTAAGSARVETAFRAAPSKKAVKLVAQPRATRKSNDFRRLEANISATAEVPNTPIPSTAVASTSLPEPDSITTRIPTTTIAVNAGKAAELKTIREQMQTSATLPSQLFSKQDKRAMAQQFLMHQIRNGWPYDDRFYRSDLDAFSPEQRRDMARIQFSDN